MSERYIIVVKQVPNEDFTPLEPEFKLVYLDSLSREEKDSLYSDILPNTEGIIATGPVNSELIAKALRLKVIMVNGAGYDDIDVRAASALQIPVYNIPDTTAAATAELALTLMMSVARRVNELNYRMRTDSKNLQSYFEIGRNPGISLYGKTLGIIGMGNIGSRLAKMASSALNMKIVYTQRHQLPLGLEQSRRFMYFHDLLAVSDVVSINCPLTDETREMINEKAFMRMKAGAILINTARGDIVDQKQLVRFLKTGKLYGAGLDVFPNNSDVDPELLTMPNVICTPHIGTNTHETRKEMSDRIVSIVKSVCDDEAVLRGNLVNADSLKSRKN
ncbi:MAG: hypothetical protein IJI14_02850 [Anaerolineaceae bacterium]|nr:hypothetical protein [Anaerolineaceae bacterium]